MMPKKRIVSIMKIFLQRQFINTMLLIALILLSFTGYLTYQHIQNLLIANNWILHTYKVIGSADQIQIGMLDAETQLNNYLFTNDNSLAESSLSNLNVIEPNVLILRDLTIDNPEQTHSVDQLSKLIQKKISIFHNIIGRYSKSNPLPPAIIEERLKLKYQIENIISKLKYNELILLEKRNSNFNILAKQTNTILFLAALLTETIFILSIVLLNYYLQQRILAEKKQNASEAYKTAILNAVSDAIITIDTQGVIQSYNSQTIQMFGYNNAGLNHMNINKLIADIDDKTIFTIRELAKECIGKRNNGTTFPTEISTSKMAYSDADEQIYVIVIRDITERKKVDVMKNEFVSVISHELRTPLTSIRGSLGLLLGGTVGTFSDKAAKLLDIAKNNCERLLLLINDILDIEKIESGKMHFNYNNINVRKLVDEAIAINKMSEQKFGITIKVNESIDDISIKVDHERMLQVLSHLISNAAKFSHSGGQVTLDITKKNGIARISVTDNGPGIPIEFRSHIFNKFSQADSSDTRNKSGTGLGLSISKAIIEQFGGHFNYSSIENKQTTFYIELPIWNDGAMQLPDNTLHTNQGSNTNRLLICEDDEDQAKYLSTILQSTDYQIDIAHTIEAARNFITNNHYNLLVLDLLLPDQDGVAFIKELRANEKTRDTPIIVISIIAETGRSLLGSDAFSVLSWLEKPVDLSKLLNVITSIKQSTAKKMPHILQIEDDLDTQNLIATLLEEQAVITSVTTLEETRNILKREHFDLVILDLLLPDGNGAQLLPDLANYKLPIIVYSTLKLEDSYSNYVTNKFVKSKTSKDQLVKAIMTVLNH